MSAWADKYDAHVSALSGDGSRDNPYIINAAADWAILSYSCGKQNEGELDFSGKYIKLNADIKVTTNVLYVALPLMAEETLFLTARGKSDDLSYSLTKTAVI